MLFENAITLNNLLLIGPGPDRMASESGLSISDVIPPQTDLLVTAMVDYHYSNRH